MIVRPTNDVAMQGRLRERENSDQAEKNGKSAFLAYKSPSFDVAVSGVKDLFLERLSSQSCGWRHTIQWAMRSSWMNKAFNKSHVSRISWVLIQLQTHHYLNNFKVHEPLTLCTIAALKFRKVKTKVKGKFPFDLLQMTAEAAVAA